MVDDGMFERGVSRIRRPSRRCSCRSRLSPGAGRAAVLERIKDRTSPPSSSLQPRAQRRRAALRRPRLRRMEAQLSELFAKVCATRGARTGTRCSPASCPHRQDRPGQHNMVPNARTSRSAAPWLTRAATPSIFSIKGSTSWWCATSRDGGGLLRQLPGHLQLAEPSASPRLQRLAAALRAGARSAVNSHVLFGPGLWNETGSALRAGVRRCARPSCTCATPSPRFL